LIKLLHLDLGRQESRREEALAQSVCMERRFLGRSSRVQRRRRRDGGDGYGLRRGGQRRRCATRTMILDMDRLRMSTAATDVVFRGDLNKVWVLRSKDHTYLS